MIPFFVSVCVARHAADQVVSVNVSPSSLFSTTVSAASAHNAACRTLSGMSSLPNFTSQYVTMAAHRSSLVVVSSRSFANWFHHRRLRDSSVYLAWFQIERTLHVLNPSVFMTALRLTPALPWHTLRKEGPSTCDTSYNFQS